MNKLLEQVKLFHEVYNQPIARFPQLPAPGERELRKRLLLEEFEELLLAEQENDLTEIADALGDMAYIIAGTALAYGIPLAEVVDEIQRANMSKLGADGKPIIREDGKVLKGPNYVAPKIKEVLDRAYFAWHKLSGAPE